jgi:lipoprotein NlpD
MTDLKERSRAPGFLGLVFFAALLSGCVAPGPAPVRDGTAPPRTGVPPSTTTQPLHVVRPGDTLLGIARLYGVTPKDLLAWNQLTDPNQLHVGQEIRVGPPPSATPPPVAIATPVDVQPVRPGAEGLGTTIIKQEPKGGKQPYSDDAWAMLQPKPSLPPVVPPPAPVPDADKPAPAEQVWLWPANGQVIGTFDEAANKGLDIAGKPGDPIIASAGGKVVYSGSGLRGYGKLVIIKHDANYLTAYAHNQQLLVKEGESVNKGQ